MLLCHASVRVRTLNARYGRVLMAAKTGSETLVLKVIRRQRKLVFECIKGKMFSIKTKRSRKYVEAYKIVDHEGAYLNHYHIKIERGRAICHCHLSTGQQRDDLYLDLQYGESMQQYRVDEITKGTRLRPGVLRQVPSNLFVDLPTMFSHLRGLCAILAENFKEGDVVSVRTL